MLKFVVGGALAAIVATAAFAQAAPRSGHDGPRGHAKMEARGDVAVHVARLFARLDTDKDGSITAAEIGALHAKREARSAKRAERRAKAFDPATMFGHLDANHDGKVTRAEAESARTAHAQGEVGKPAIAHATAIGALFTRGDTNKDGVVSRTEFDALATQLHARAETGLRRGGAAHIFGLADVNKDGKVTLAEAQTAALQHFDQADLNHDGKLTPEERRQARQQLKAQNRPS